MHGLRLDETHPELALQWHPTKNGDLTPRDVTFGSGTSVWWVCHKVDNGVCDTPGCGTVHEWQAVILNRAQAGNGCSWCHQGASNSVCRCKSLGFKYPSIAAELYDKTIDAYTISAGSSTILTWICPKKHKWNTAAATRTSGGSGCPICNVNHAETELARVLREHPCVQKFAKKRFPCTDIFNGNKVRMLEPDATGVTSSEKGFTIEADGRQHFESVNYFGNGEWTDFRDQVCRDLAKNRTAWNNGWSVLRISFEEFDNIEFWVNKFIDDIMSNDKQVAMTSNNDKYMTLKRDSEGFFQTIHK
jgi:very-short-patch-repair endonuclease